MQLNGHRCIEGTLRGYDQFVNLTLADAVDKTVTGTSAASNRDLGMVVRFVASVSGLGPWSVHGVACVPLRARPMSFSLLPPVRAFLFPRLFLPALATI